ncbi:protein-disulfide reductase DsbD family protein [Planctopirus hydrillae]|uniref:Cytochrome C biogenesis protein transmembrane domain-containing protein n=1 Tax=Planctopirus hydrillae TaxID=1841610 RepID=A0A1C3E8Q1_9PLAN|nr:cytochrome c biogenesis protein CcdA [Planctopirus hydrillae]ODA29647.1 hypothetical protein A6X21_08240 [Planctopirus hydrillae]
MPFAATFQPAQIDHCNSMHPDNSKHSDNDRLDAHRSGVVKGRHDIRHGLWQSLWQLSAVVLAVLVFPIAAEAQFDDLFGDSAGDSLLGGAAAKPVVSAQLTLLPEQASGLQAQQFQAQLSVTVVLPEGHYIYDVQGKFEGRTQIRTKLPEGVTAAGAFVSAKPPQKVFEPLFGVDLFKLHDSATWTQVLNIAPTVDLKNLVISGGLEGQYCSAGEGGQCLPIIPAIKFSAKLEGNIPERMPAKATTTASIEQPAAGSMLPFQVTERLKRGVKPQPIEFTAQLTPENAKPGEKVELVLTAKIDPKYHTFSMTQPDGFGGSATVVDFEQLNGLSEAGPFVADHPHEVEPGAGGPLEVYYDKVTWTKPFLVAEGQAPGIYGLKGVIRSQACTKGSCVPMPKFSFALGAQEKAEAIAPPVTAMTSRDGSVVGETGKAPIPPDEPATSTEQPNAPTTEIDNSDADSVVFWTDQDDENSNGLIDSGIVSFLVASFLGGWLALLTPCAFPMVPITVGFFLKQGHGKSLGLAIVYCLSIIAAFTLLGVGLALVFGGPVLTQLANNPWMNVIIGTIFVAFGLSMLGLFELQPPSWLLTYTANQESAGGYLGVIFMALTFTLTSFTCTFPVAGSLLATASQGDVLWPILGMLAFSTAFALPFFFLALFPSMLRRLPKSGGWLFTLKVVLGFVEIGAAIKFFSVADQSMNPQPLLFDFALVMVAWSVLAITAGLYLLGVFHLSHDQPQDRISSLQALSGTAFLGLSLFLMVGVLTPEKSGGALMPQILAFAPPQLKHGFKETDELGPVLVHDGIPFALDVNRALTVAKSRQQPLFLDFTGVNCVNCRLMEQKMKQPDNRSRLERFLGIQLFADRVPNITDSEYAEKLKERNIFLQEKWFGELTLPLYAVMSPDGKTVLATYKGLELKEGEFAAFLDKGWNRFEKWKAKQVASQEPASVERR